MVALFFGLTREKKEVIEMEQMQKVECTLCGGRYYVLSNDVDLLLPKNIKLGEAFPNPCPFCRLSGYAVLVDGKSS